jgi:hypothetical protein
MFPVNELFAQMQKYPLAQSYWAAEACPANPTVDAPANRTAKNATRVLAVRSSDQNLRRSNTTASFVTTHQRFGAFDY